MSYKFLTKWLMALGLWLLALGFGFISVHQRKSAAKILGSSLLAILTIGITRARGFGFARGGVRVTAILAILGFRL